MRGAKQLVVEHDFQGRAAVIELHDGWDEHHVGQLLEAVTRAIERDRTTLIFDLANATDLDAAVLHFLADVQTVADRSGWTILVVKPVNRAAAARLTRAPDRLVPACATRAEARLRAVLVSGFGR